MPPKVTPRRQALRRNAKAPPADELQVAPAPKESLDVDNNDGQGTSMDAQSSGLQGRPPPEPLSPAPGSPARPVTSRTGSAADSTSGRPVQRLDSLSRRTGLELSPGPGNKPAGLKFQPKSFIRRSKEEREAQARAEAEKLQARIAANAASSTPSSDRGDRGGRGGRGGYQSRGGGGMGRYKAERYGVGQASGVLGGTTRPEEGARKGRFGKRGPWSGISRDSNFRSTRVKNGPSVKSERDRDGDIAMGGFGGRQTNLEGAAYVSSDEEPDAAAGPRVNIEHINLVSDEDSDREPESSKGKERAKSIRAPGWALKPVRLDRHEHVERAVGVNTEASSLTSAELRKKAKERDEAEGSLFLPQEEESVTVKPEMKKGSAKIKDVEFVRDERRWKGVYQDENDDDAPKIKQEPPDAAASDAMVLDTVDSTAAAPTSPNPTSAPEPAPKAGKPHPTPPKPKRHRKSLLRARKPVLQTDEDRAEWARHEEDIQILADELGVLATIAVARASKPQATDAEGDTPTAEVVEADTEGEAAGTKMSKDKKDGHVYLFQLPPLVPTLIDPVIKKEEEEEEGERDVVETSSRPARTGPGTATPAPAPALDNPIAIKPDPDGPDDAKTEPTALDPAPPITTSLPGGLLGHLTVHTDGECVLSWGGVPSAPGSVLAAGKEVLSMSLGRGGEGELLQEVVVADVGGAGGGDGGTGRGEEAWAVGQLVGGFVVTPDWGRMFGGW
ncbi:hypothetical protein MMC08_003068 [Hypocenomyce scalaris]|nr:hypothetical protein [Hypocenomyce scalaris]